MHLQESGEMYLETILILSRKKSNVRSIDICEHMGYSKPSVSRAVKLLGNDGCIDIDADGFITLTEKGKKIANDILDRHRIISAFFESIGVDEKTASEDACRMEHVISDETYLALKRFYENMK